jgi:hypothetical protein
MWFNSTWLDGVKTVTSLKQHGVETLTNYFSSLLQSFLLSNEEGKMRGACNTTGYIQEKFVHHFSQRVQRQNTTW